MTHSPWKRSPDDLRRIIDECLHVFIDTSSQAKLLDIIVDIEYVQRRWRSNYHVAHTDTQLTWELGHGFVLTSRGTIAKFWTVIEDENGRPTVEQGNPGTRRRDYIKGYAPVVLEKLSPHDLNLLISAVQEGPTSR